MGQGRRAGTDREEGQEGESASNLNISRRGRPDYFERQTDTTPRRSAEMPDPGDFLLLLLGGIAGAAVKTAMDPTTREQFSKPITKVRKTNVRWTGKKSIGVT